MSKRKVYIKRQENSWIDKDNSPYREDVTVSSSRIDGMKNSIDSDSIFDFDTKDPYGVEIGKNKQLNKIQKMSRPLVLKRRSILQTRRGNKRTIKRKELNYE